MMDTNRTALAAFADLFSYPHGDVAAMARMAPVSDQAAEVLRAFASAVANLGQSGMEELYTSTFEFAPLCIPYIGHQLCRDSAQRSLFLARLAGVYASEGFEPREELPDHIAEVLRYLAFARDEAQRQVLLRDGLLPALDRMVPTLNAAANPYRLLFDALVAELAPVRAAGQEEARP